MKNKLLLGCVLFIQVCFSAFPDETESALLQIIERINCLKMNYYILNKTNTNELEIFERVNDGFVVLNGLIGKVTANLNNSQRVHIAFPLADKMKYFFDLFSERRLPATYHDGYKHFFGVSDELDELDFLFGLTGQLHWFLVNFPLANTNAWSTKPGSNIFFTNIDESINIWEEIVTSRLRPAGQDQYDSNVIMKKINALKNIAADNSDSVFSGTVIYELNRFAEEIMNRSDDEVVHIRIRRLNGLYYYIKYNVDLVDLY